MRRTASSLDITLELPQGLCLTWREVFDCHEDHLRLITGLLLGSEKQVSFVLQRAEEALEAACQVPACHLAAYSLARKRMINCVLQVLKRGKRMNSKKRSFGDSTKLQEDRNDTGLQGHDDVALLASLTSIVRPETRLEPQLQI